jgi:hypothetical protein
MSRVVKRAPEVDRWKKADEQRHDHEWQKRLEKAMHYAKGSPLHLDREERLELACMVPGASNELESWKELTQPQLDSLINMLEGFIYISYMLSQRMDDGTPDDLNRTTIRSRVRNSNNEH